MINRRRRGRLQNSKDHPLVFFGREFALREHKERHNQESQQRRPRDRYWHPAEAGPDYFFITIPDAVETTINAPAESLILVIMILE